MAPMWYEEYKNYDLLKPVQRPIARLGPGVSCDIYPAPEDLCNIDEFIRWAVASTINLRKLDDTSLLRIFDSKQLIVPEPPLGSGKVYLTWTSEMHSIGSSYNSFAPLNISNISSSVKRDTP